MISISIPLYSYLKVHPCLYFKADKVIIINLYIQAKVHIKQYSEYILVGYMAIENKISKVGQHWTIRKGIF